jgi:cytochrome c
MFTKNVPSLSVSGILNKVSKTIFQSAKSRAVVQKTFSVMAVVLFVIWEHVYSGKKVFVPAAKAEPDPGWLAFSKKYNVAESGADGYYVRAVRDGYSLVHKTYEAGWRFTRKTANSKVSACSNCHTDEQIAYAFVNSDRYDSKLGKRVSFEERVTRCYVSHLDGFVPTIYDPAIRDIRIYARMISHHLQLGEGQLKPEQLKPDLLKESRATFKFSQGGRG